MPSEFVIMTKFRNIKRLFYNLYVDMFSESFVVLIIDGASLGIFCKRIWPTEKPRLLTLFTFSSYYHVDDIYCSLVSAMPSKKYHAVNHFFLNGYNIISTTGHCGKFYDH